MSTVSVGKFGQSYGFTACSWAHERWSERRRIAVTVHLLDRGIPIARGRSANIGLEGMYVEIPRHDFPACARLEVEFALPPPLDAPGVVHRLPVVIVRSTKEGIGLKFSTFDLQAFRTLQRLIYEVPASPAAERWLA